jgi:hypothetical protein
MQSEDDSTNYGYLTVIVVLIVSNLICSLT